jgi:nucleoside 2-deoxyribosyltransferase
MEELGKGRVHVFLDEKDIEVGQRIAEEILDAIRQCDEFMVLLSANSKGRPWVLFEIGVACGQEKPVMAILHNLGPQDMPEMIYPFKAADLNEFDTQYLEQLRKRIQKGRK